MPFQPTENGAEVDLPDVARYDLSQMKKTNVMNRRDMLLCSSSAVAVAALPTFLTAGADPQPYERPPLSARRFTSPAIEEAIVKTKRVIGDSQLARIFENCLPNTLDTTVFIGEFEGKPDTFVVTGDIEAMWLRDSSAQLMPYLPYCKQDGALARLLEGAIRRQARQILLDPYANAFLKNASDKPLSWSVNDKTEMRPGVGERKWELDSLCYPVRLAHTYWKLTGSAAAFDSQWHKAAKTIVRTLREQQRWKSPGPYEFRRLADKPSETLALSGDGNPARPNGMICSMFRPSDDACIFPYLIPSNLFAVIALRMLAEMAAVLFSDAMLAEECTALSAEVNRAVEKYGVVRDDAGDEIYAYEVDGYGSHLLMDDAGAPGLLSLAYLGSVRVDDPRYQQTRKFCLSLANPYFFRGSAAEGIGSPHIGLEFIWPMSIIMRALTSRDGREITECLRWLRNTTAGKYFMHEAFHKDNPSDFTRAWFAWANTLFGELILKLAAEMPDVLKQSLG